MQKQAASALTNKVIPVRIVHKSLGKKRRILLIAVVVIVVASLIGWCVYRHVNSAASKIESDKYQVVFAGNNQAWFGKLQLLSDGSYQLTHVFYYSGQGANSAQRPNADAEPPQLVKMGSELHGPTDGIIFPKDQVVFWENLRPDSKVTKAIQDYAKRSQ